MTTTISPHTFFSRVAIRQGRVRYGPTKDEVRWFVCVDGIPLGAAFDFYDAGELRNAYPWKDGQREGVATEDEARELMAKMERHVADVLALPRNERKGSSRHWP